MSYKWQWHEYMVNVPCAYDFDISLSAHLISKVGDVKNITFEEERQTDALLLILLILLIFLILSNFEQDFIWSSLKLFRGEFELR